MNLIKRLWPLLLSALVVLSGLGVFGVHHWRARHARDHAAPTPSPPGPGPHVRALLASGVNPTEFFAFERGHGRYWIDDPALGGTTNGAKCDGSTDDYTAITSAATFAASAHAELDFPAGTCAIGTPLSPPVGAQWVCTGSRGPGACDIKPLSGMRAIFQLHTVSGVTPVPSRLVGLTADGNGLANFGYEQQGFWFGEVDRPFVKSTVVDCYHDSTLSTPMTLDSFTQSIGGGSPSMSIGNFSLPDPGYTGFILATNNVCEKIATTGTLGGGSPATYVSSFDGGATYQSAPQNVMPLSNIDITNFIVYQQCSGVQVNFPGTVGTTVYHAGDFYCLTAHVPTETTGDHHVVNSESHFIDPWCDTTGTAFASAAIGLGSVIPTTVIASGTATTTTLGQVIHGSSTTWLSSAPFLGQQPRYLDPIVVTGAGQWPIACVLDDQEVATVQSDVPLASVSGATWGIGVGTGWHSDANADVARQVIEGGRFTQMAVGLLLLGKSDGGPVASQMRVENYGFWAYEIGSTAATQITNVEAKPTPITSGAKFHLMPSTNINLDVPRQQVTDADITGPGGACISDGQNKWGHNALCFDYVPQPFFMMPPTLVTVTSASQVIPTPCSMPGHGTSLIELSAASPITLTGGSGGRILDYPQNCGGGANGYTAFLLNVGTSAISLTSAGTNMALATSPLELDQNQGVMCVSNNFLNWICMSPSGSGSVSSVTGTSGVSCSPTSGAVVCSNTGVTSVTGAGSTACSPTTGGVTCTTSNVVSNGLTGITSCPQGDVVQGLSASALQCTATTAHGVAVGQGTSPLNFTAAGGNGTLLQGKGPFADPAYTAWTIADPGSAGDTLVSDGTNWTAQTTAGHMVGRAIISVAGLSTSAATWSHAAVAGTTSGTLVQLASDGRSWGSLVFGVTTVVALPTSAAASCIFELDGYQSGDLVIMALHTGQPSGANWFAQNWLTLTYAFKNTGVTPTWPTDYSRGPAEPFPASVSDTLPVHLTTFVQAPSGNRLWVQPSVLPITTNATSMTFALVGDAWLDVQDWR